MKTSITNDEARTLIDQYLQTPNMLLHSRETEVIMRKLALHFGEDVDFWGISGLLHDLDYEEVENDLDNHGPRTIGILKEKGYDIPEMFQAILAHVEGHGSHGVKRESKLDFSLAAAENISGFIIAVALMRPTKLEGMAPKSVVKKLKDKRFASKVNREFINDIEKTGMDRVTFLQLAIEAIQEIEGEIGL